MKKKRYYAFALSKERTHLKDRLSVIVRSDDVAGEFLWNCFSRTLCYASELIGEIADDIVSDKKRKQLSNLVEELGSVVKIYQEDPECWGSYR